MDDGEGHQHISYDVIKKEQEFRLHEIEEENNEFIINTETDNQLKFALKLLNG